MGKHSCIWLLQAKRVDIGHAMVIKALQFQLSGDENYGLNK